MFQRLLRRDPTGRSWLPQLIGCAPNQSAVAPLLARDTGALDPALSTIRSYPDRILRRYGLKTIPLEMCFEHPLPPPGAFLRWLIQNPSQMTWPPSKGAERRFGVDTQARREALFGRRGPESAATAQADALRELDRLGAPGSRRAWWAFEGYTEVDCYLETPQLVLVIEGKRTEALSASTEWFPQRSQLIRNLEVARDIADNRAFGVLVITEADIGMIPEAILERVTIYLTHKPALANLGAWTRQPPSPRPS